MLAITNLDPDSDTPIYRQLYAHIRTAIESGTLPDGYRLPPTRELAGSLGLNRTTVSSAYDLLETQGLIKGHVGRGSFVSAKPGTERSVFPPPGLPSFCSRWKPFGRLAAR